MKKLLLLGLMTLLGYNALAQEAQPIIPMKIVQDGEPVSMAVKQDVIEILHTKAVVCSCGLNYGQRFQHLTYIAGADRASVAVQCFNVDVDAKLYPSSRNRYAGVPSGSAYSNSPTVVKRYNNEQARNKKKYNDLSIRDCKLL